MRLILSLLLLLPLLLAGCGRPLAPQEVAFLDSLQGRDMNLSKVRIHPGLVTLTQRFPVPPRITCKSRLFPPSRRPTAIGSAPAMTLWDDIFVRSDWYARDLTGGYPDRLTLPQAMLLAHEALHAWQWQHRKDTGYTPFRAVGEHLASADPYLFNPDTHADFRSFGYEQQGAILEEYVCCRTLAPAAERTKRLHDMLAQVLPVAPLSQRPKRQDILLPWRGVKLKGICS